MTFIRTLSLGILSLGLLSNFGCSSSSPGTSSTTVVTTTGISTCTSTTSSGGTCIPTLGNYGNTIEYFGKVGVPNNGAANLLQSLITNAIPGAPTPSTSLIIDYSYVDILLQASGNGPSETMTVLVGPPPSYEYTLTGYTTFTASKSNASAGVMELDAAGLSIIDPIQINSLVTPWDGSVYPTMPPMTVTIGTPPTNGSAPEFGIVELNRIQ